MDRNTALNILKKPAHNPEFINQDFEYIANKLEISVESLGSFFKLPIKSYRDYKSQQSLYGVGAKVLKSLGVERGGKR